MNTALSVAPTVEPISTDEAKAHLRVDIGEDDTYIGALITAARQHAENVTRRQLVTATWLGYLDGFPATIMMPYAPLQSATINYVNTGGTDTLLAAAEYTVDTTGRIGLIYEAYGKTWPATRGFTNDVTITFLAGYGAAGSDVPEPLRHAIKMLVSHWYEQREPIVVGGAVSDVPIAVDALLFPYRVWGF